MILCLDENLPRTVAEAIHALGVCEAHHVLDALPRATPDEQVFQYVASHPGWVLVTQDRRISRNPQQREALRASGIGTFILTGRAQRDRLEFAHFFFGRLAEMMEVSGATRPPFIFGIPDRGPIQRLD